MAITVEELEIRIAVQKEKAIKDLEEVRKKLEEAFSKAMPGMQQAAKQIQQGAAQAKTAAEKAAVQMGKVAEKQKAAFVKSSGQIAKQLVKDSEHSIKIARQMNAELSKIDNEKLQQQQDVNQAIERMLQREVAMRQKVSQAAQPRTAILQGSRTSTQILNEQPQQTAKTPDVQEQTKNLFYFQQMSEKILQYANLIKQQMSTLAAPMMQSLNKGLAQYYAKLDVIKAALHKIGLYGKEVAEPIKKSTEKAIPEVKKLGNELQATAKRGKTAFEQLGATITRVFKFAVVYKSLRAMFSFISNGIKSAINAPEIENMFRVAFGAGADEAAKFAEAMRTAFGIDPYASKQMLGTFQNMSTAMGIGTKNAAEMSKGLTLLANDISSLYNIDPQQAAENLQSALAGQGRAVRKYGYIILDSTIKETAYRLGIAKTGAELTEQQKVLARYMTLQEQSKNAQGDLARTINNVANQLRILGQNIVAAGRSIGTAFIPFIQAAMPPLNAFFTLLQRIGNAISTFTFGLFGIDFSQWKKQQETIIGGTGDMSQAEDEYADSIDKAAKAQKGLLSGFDTLNISKRKESAAGGITGEGGFDIPKIETPAGQSPFEKMADSLQASLEKIKAAFEPFITNVSNSFKWFFDNVLVPLKNYTINDLLPAFFEALAAVLNSPVWVAAGEQIAKIYKEFLQPVAAWVGEKVVELFGWIKDNGDLVAGIIIAVGAAFLTWKVILGLDKIAGIIIAIVKALKLVSAGGVLAKILPNISKLLIGLQPILSWIWVTAIPSIGAALATVGSAIGAAVTAIAAFLGISVGWLVAIVAAVVAAVAAVIIYWDKIKVFFSETIPNWWNGTVVPFFQNMWNSLVEGVKSAVDKAKQGWDNFVIFFKELPETIGFIIGKTARILVDFVTITIPQWWKNIKEWFGKFVQTIVDSFNKAIETIKQWGVDVWNFISVEIPKWIDSIGKWFSELPAKIWEWLVSAYEKVKQWGIDLINWAIVKVPEFINLVINFFKELPAKIFQVGKDIVKSLWDGIAGMIGWLGDKIKGFINGIIEGFNKGFSKGFNERNLDVNVTQKNKNATSSYNVPRLASGGVLTAPRLVMAGEYAGARNNPEIVTPQSLMYETSLKAQQAANQPLIAIMGQVLQAIRDGKVIELDGYELGRQVDKARSNNNLLLGM